MQYNLRNEQTKRVNRENLGEKKASERFIFAIYSTKKCKGTSAELNAFFKDLPFLFSKFQ